MKPSRPGSATTFAVFNLILGGLLLICGIVSMQEAKVEVNGKDLTQEKNDFLAKEIPAYSTYRVASPILMMVIAVGLCLSAVGLLMFQNWGRMLAIGVGGVLVLYHIFDTIYQIALVNPGVAKFTNTTDFKAGAVVSGFRTVFIVGWALLVVAYGIVLVLGLMGGRTARAFRGEFDPQDMADDRGRRRGRDSDDDDDDDDRSRRRERGRADDDDRVRRRRDDDDDEDRVRRRRDDDDDDRPRRRPSRRDDDDRLSR